MLTSLKAKHLMLRLTQKGLTAMTAFSAESGLLQTGYHDPFPAVTSCRDWSLFTRCSGCEINQNALVVSV